MKETESRNTFIDVMRGLAMLMVVLQHTMAGCTIHSQDSFLFNVLWSLQMPLFILISGYVTKYSRGCQDSQSLWLYMKRRTIAYLLPWVVWTFMVRGLIFGQHRFLDIGWIVYNLDSGYWFLITIWTISVFFGIAEFFSRKVANKQVKVLVTCFIFGVFGIVLALVGWKLGLNFMGIKLTLYYMPFYLMGYLWGKYSDAILTKKWGTKFVSIMIALSTLVWIGIMANVNLFMLQDNGIDVALRVLCSVTGCISICGLSKALCEASELNGGGYFRWAGAHSMEIYLGQYLLLSILQLQERPMFDSILGMGLTVVNFLLTMALLTIVIKLLNQNEKLRFFLFGKH